jgi:hypothetical protein
MRATLNVGNGASIEIHGSEGELATLIALVASGTAGRPSKAASGSSTDSVTSKPRRAARPPSPARIRAMKLQGQYMGLLRGLPGRQQAEVKALAKKDSVAAGIALAKKLGQSGKA